MIKIHYNSLKLITIDCIQNFQILRMISCQNRKQQRIFRFGLFVNDIFVPTILLEYKRCVSGRSRYNSECIKVCERQSFPKHRQTDPYKERFCLSVAVDIDITFLVNGLKLATLQSSSSIILIWKFNLFDFRLFFCTKFFSEKLFQLIKYNRDELLTDFFFIFNDFYVQIDWMQLSFNSRHKSSGDTAPLVFQYNEKYQSCTKTFQVVLNSVCFRYT